MAGISKAERERRKADAVAVDAPAPDAVDAVEQPTARTPTLVRMVRDASQYPAPHAIDVNPAEVGNYKPGGWVKA